MKKALISLALGLALCAPRMSFAAASNPPTFPGPLGSGVNAGAFENLTFVGAPIYRVEVNVAADSAQLLLSGQGLLYGISCSSGSTGAYGIAFDSGSASGMTVATLGKALTGPVYSNGQLSVSASTQTVLLGPGLGLNLQSNPAPFNNGLVVITHGSALNCLVQARLNTGANPGP